MFFTTFLLLPVVTHTFRDYFRVSLSCPPPGGAEPTRECSVLVSVALTVRRPLSAAPRLS